MCFDRPTGLKKTSDIGCQCLKTRRVHIKIQISGFTLKILRSGNNWVHVTPQWHLAEARLQWSVHTHVPRSYHAAALTALPAQSQYTSKFITPGLFICSPSLAFLIQREAILKYLKRGSRGQWKSLSWWFHGEMVTLITIFRCKGGKNQKQWVQAAGRQI